jgi:hypothetical protein
VGLEVRAYQHLAAAYFNLADLKHSQYYKERAMLMLVEPEGSRTRALACRELESSL